MRSTIVLLTGAALVALVLVFGLRADDKPPAKLEPKDAPTAINEIEGKDLKHWIEETRNEDPSAREKAIRAIMAFGPQATIAVPYLVDRCTDFEASPRVRAVIALTFIAIRQQDIHKVVEALARRLEAKPDPQFPSRLLFDDPQGIVRYHAAVALNRFGPDEAKSAIPQLINAAKDWTNFETRRAGILALRNIARDPKKGPDPRATEALIYLLGTNAEGIPHEKAADVKLEAIIGLAAMGWPEDKNLQKRIEASLLAHINHRDHRLAIWAHYSQITRPELDDKGIEKQLDAIAAFRNDPDVVARAHCATAIGQCGSKVKAHVSVLIKMLEDKENEVFVAACQALVNIGEPGKDAIAKLTEIAESKDEKIETGRKVLAKATLDGIEMTRKDKLNSDAKDKEDKKGEKKDKKGGAP